MNVNNNHTKSGGAQVVGFPNTPNTEEERARRLGARRTCTGPHITSASPMRLCASATCVARGPNAFVTGDAVGVTRMRTLMPTPQL
jgi:hypothetical protein